MPLNPRFKPIKNHDDLTILLSGSHLEYILTDGSRTFTGNQSWGGNNILNVGTLFINDFLSINNPSPAASLDLIISSPTKKGILVKQAAGQSVNPFSLVSSTNAPFFMLEPSGHLGIGVDPLTSLHIVDLASLFVRLDSTNGNQVGVQFIDSGSTPGNWLAGMHGGDPDNSFKISESLSFGTNDRIIINSGGNMILVSGGNFGVGATSWGSSAQNVLAILDGTPPGSSPANMIQLYSEDNGGGTSELFVRDEDGNITELSPHPTLFLNTLPVDNDHVFPHAYWSRNPYLGKEIFIDMALLAFEVQRLSGKKIITINDIPRKDWDDNQELIRIDRADQITKAQERIIELDLLIAGEENEERISDLIDEKQGVVIPETYTKKQTPEWIARRI